MPRPHKQPAAPVSRVKIQSVSLAPATGGPSHELRTGPRGCATVCVAEFVRILAVTRGHGPTSHEVGYGPVRNPGKQAFSSLASASAQADAPAVLTIELPTSAAGSRLGAVFALGGTVSESLRSRGNRSGRAVILFAFPTHHLCGRFLSCFVHCHPLPFCSQ
jgi:hypothetical protein